MMKKGLALLLTLCLLLIPGCSSKKENVIKIVDGPRYGTEPGCIG